MTKQQKRIVVQNLIEEIRNRKYLLEGNPIVDGPFVKYRITILAGILCVYALEKVAEGIVDDEIEFIRTFVDKNIRNLSLWSEGAVPYFLAIYWLMMSTRPTMLSDRLLFDLIDNISTMNNIRSKFVPLPDSYCGIDEAARWRINNELDVLDLPTSFRLQTVTDQRSLNARYSSTLLGLYYLLVRRNWKQRAKLCWDRVSLTAHAQFLPDNKYDFCRWENTSGKNDNFFLIPRQKWSEVKEAARRENASNIPNILQRDPVHLLSILSVYPHRLTGEVVTWLDGALGFKSW
jgi:hypothetical protein